METLLDNINTAVKEDGGKLNREASWQWKQTYRRLLKRAEQECPLPEPDSDQKKKGRLACSKARNLLERLRNYAADVLCFMDNEAVPFTHNQGERDIRMTQGQQKRSGCFRSIQGAEIFCALRRYLSTCRKHTVGPGEALECLFASKCPVFIQQRLNILRPGAE